jgi:hypothetical protein
MVLLSSVGVLSVALEMLKGVLHQAQTWNDASIVP